MFCTKCGNELVQNAKFCTKCGNPVAIVESNIAYEVAEEPKIADELVEGSKTADEFIANSEINSESAGEVLNKECNEENVVPNIVNDAGAPTVKKKKKKGLFILIPLLTIILLCAIAVGLFFVNDNVRVSVTLKLGEMYLSELKYDEAIACFDKAIEVDERCTQAYMGKLTAYHGKEDEVQLAKYYDELIEISSEWDAEFAQGIESDIEYIYLDCKNIYPDDKNKQFEIIGKGLTLIPEDFELGNEYISIGIEIIDELYDNAKFDEALKIYDELLVYGQDEEVIQGLRDVLSIYLDILINNQEYDKAKELIEKYKEYVPEIESYLDKIEQLEQYYALLTDCLTDIAKNAQANNIDDVFDIMHSDIYAQVIDYVDDLGTIKAFDTSYGLVGVYNVTTNKFGTHMVYYGDYEDDKREGNGIWLAYNNGNNYYAVGEWSDDAPNGEQVVREWNDVLASDVVHRVVEGTAKDGLWDGPAMWKFEQGYFTSYYPVTFDNGEWVVLDYEDDGDRIVSKTGTTSDQRGSAIMTAGSAEKDIRGIAGYASAE